MTLLSPVDGATDVSPLPVFEWVAQPGAAQYRLILKRNNKTKLNLKFEASDVCSETLCSVDFATLVDVKPLKVGKAYRWFIRAKGAGQKYQSTRQSYQVGMQSSLGSNTTDTPDPSPTITPLRTPDLPIAPRAGVTYFFKINAGDVNTLRQRVAFANTVPFGDTVVLLLQSGTSFVITDKYPPDPDTGSALPIIEGNLVVRGMDATFINPANVTIQRSDGRAIPSFDLFNNTGTLTLYDLTLKNGGGLDRSNGGGIVNGGVLNLNRVVFDNNRVLDYGGAIFNLGGSVTLSQVRFSNNFAVSTVNSRGGAIYTLDGGSVRTSYTGTNSGVYCAQFSSNVTSGSGGALVVGNSGSTVNLDHSIFLTNSAAGYGALDSASGAVTARSGFWEPAPSTIPGQLNSVKPGIDTSGAITSSPARLSMNGCPVPTPPQPPVCSLQGAGLNDVNEIKSTTKFRLQPTLDDNNWLFEMTPGLLPRAASNLPNRPWLWNPYGKPASLTVASMDILASAGVIPWVSSTIEWYQVRINNQYVVYVDKASLGLQCTLTTLPIPLRDSPPPPVSTLVIFASVSPIVSVFRNNLSPATMGTCGLHFGTSLDCSQPGATLDIVPRNLELCIDTANNRSLCNNSDVPVYSPVNACGILFDDPFDNPDSGKSIILNIDRLIRDASCQNDSIPDATGDRYITITHLIPNPGSLSSGEVLSTSNWVKVITSDMIGNLCKDINAVSLCKVRPGAPTHLAFQLTSRNANGTSKQEITDVLGFLAKPDCLYDNWKFDPGNPTVQPLANRFYSCPS